MNAGGPQISEQPGRVFQRRARLLFLLGACGVTSYLFVHLTRAPHQARPLREDGVVPLLRKELVDWSPENCAIWGDDGTLIALYAMIIPRSVVDLHDQDHRTLADGLAEIVEKGQSTEARGTACWAYWLMKGPIVAMDLAHGSNFRETVVRQLREYKAREPRVRSPWEEQSIVDTSIKPKLMAEYLISNGKITRVDTDGTYEPVLNTFPNSGKETR